MIILDRKRLKIILGILAVSLFVFTFQKASLRDNSIETMSLPVTNKVIVLDAGHRNSR